jgi:hypothetical protein
LCLYTGSQNDYSLGRNPVFIRKTKERKNLLTDLQSEEACVAGKHETVFRLINKDVNECNREIKLFLQIGHLDYEAHMLLILRFIQLRE